MPASAGQAGRPSDRRTPEEVLLAIECFLKASRQPTLLEPGEEPLTLAPDTFAIECRNGRVTLQVWDEKRNLVRRIVDFEQDKPGRLQLHVERFGKRRGMMLLFDQSRPDSERASRHGSRLVFREQFRRSLARQFPGWLIRELTTEADLEHTLSPVHPRALLTRGTVGWAAIGASTDSDNAAGVLTFGLIWLDYLRRREKRRTIEGLALFVPAGHERTACLRLRHLNSCVAQFALFVCSEDGFEDRVDPRDHGNLDTRLEPCRNPSPETATLLEEWIERLAGLPDVERTDAGGKSVSLRVRGLEFARTAGASLLFGIDRKQVARAANLGEIEAIINELSRLRSPLAWDHGNPLYTRQPEAWLESQVRHRIETIDASLLPSPVYGQVPAFAGIERGIIDLLSADRTGRLAVVEIKATADLQLPMQALDYWMRVQWHAERGEFSERGYFPAVPLSTVPPRLLLVAPALEFHPTTETLLRYFSPAIDVERIGLGAEWRREINVMFRIRGAQRPV
jgi:hypothetical protein